MNMYLRLVESSSSCFEISRGLIYLSKPPTLLHWGRGLMLHLQLLRLEPGTSRFGWGGELFLI